jgi:hypothetical protein
MEDKQFYSEYKPITLRYKKTVYFLKNYGYAPVVTVHVMIENTKKFPYFTVVQSEIKDGQARYFTDKFILYSSKPFDNSKYKYVYHTFDEGHKLLEKAEII